MAFNHQQWQQALKIKDDEENACLKKLNLANDYKHVKLPLDGSKVKEQLRNTATHKAGPQMYYFAVVDCDRNMKVLMDAGYYGKVEF